MIEEWIEVSKAVNESEQRAFLDLRDILEPAGERFTLATNVRLPNGRHDFYEYDAIVVGEKMIFVLEIKGYGGNIVCQRDRWYCENGLSFENPSNRLSIKAKTLGSLLVGNYRGLRGKLWVQDFVYVNGPNARLTDADYARRASFDVIGTSFDASTRGALKSALLDAKRWNPRAEPFDAYERKGIIEYLRGGKQRIVDDRLGKYLIEERLIATSERFERLLARDRLKAKDSAERVELHVYRLDGRRETDQRLAHDLERQIETVRRLGDLGVAPRYLLDDEAERQGRPVRYIAYEWLGSLKTLGDRIASSGAPSLRESLRLAIAVGEALATMHEQGIVHGALDPSSLYLRESRDAAPVVIGRIELARPADPERSIASIGTVGSAASCYASPEVLGNRRPGVEDDLFSFGAMLAHILRGRPLFASPAEILQRIHLPRLLEDRSADPPELQGLVRALLARSPASRPASMREAVMRLRAVLRPLEQSRDEANRIGSYHILRELRSGATGRTVVALRDDLGGEMVLKIAPRGNDEMLRREVELLRTFQHPNIVIAFNVDVLEAEPLTIGEFSLIFGEDGQRMRARLLGEHIAPFANGLFSALAYVHERGFVHRDVKPANVMIGADGKATLLDFGLAAEHGDADLIVGTAPYKSPALFKRGGWQPADDVFAAAVTFWEVVTGAHPWNGVAPEGAPTIEAEAIGALLSKDVAARLAATIRELIEEPPANATYALQALERVLRAPLEAPPLPIESSEIVLPPDVGLGDPIRALNLSAPARRALEALEAQTLADVRVLRLADLPRVKGFGRGVAEEIQALGLALTARFGEPEPGSASVMRSVQVALAPLLAADPQAASDALVVLGLPPRIVEALHAHGIGNVARLAGADPRRLERDERIGAAGVADARVRLRAYVEDREGLVVDAVLPAWRIVERATYVENVARLGADAATAIDLLESAGGFTLDSARVPVLREPLVAAPLWREDDLLAVIDALHDACAWPPKEIAELAAPIAELGNTRAMPALTTMSSEILSLMIERVAPLLRDVDVSREGRLYRRDRFDLAEALRFGVEGVALPLSLAQLLAAVERRLPRLRLPPSGTAAFSQAFERAGLVLLPDGRVERADALAREKEGARPESTLQEIDVLGLSEAARRIVNASTGGGYRLVVAEPGVYVARVRKLASELRDALGERLRVIDFDAELLHELEHDGKLTTALRVQRIKGPVAGAIEPLARLAAQRILDDLLQTPRGACALLVNAGALALTGAAHHLGKIYDRSRGGSHGLVVVCVPGDHPREHARFNRVLPLPIQPTERPIALDEVA